MEYKYGFTVIDDDKEEDLLHIVLFEKKPTAKDWNHILEELETDPDFSYLGDYRWTMRYSTEEEVNHFNEQIEYGKIRHVDGNLSEEQIN